MTRCIIIPADMAQPLTRTELTTLTDYQQVVGGWIESVQVTAVLGMLVNEEGFLRRQRINPRATLLRRLLNPPSRDQFAIVGDIVLLGIPDNEEFTDVPDDIERLLMDTRLFVVRARDQKNVVESHAFKSFWDAAQVAIVADVAQALGEIEVVAAE